MPLLAVHELSLSYGSIEAVRAVDLTVDEGEIVCLLGPNGAGKSTLLKGLVGLMRSSLGRIRFDGRDIKGHDTRSIVRAGMTLTPEGRRLFGKLTVLENLRLGSGNSTV